MSQPSISPNFPRCQQRCQPVPCRTWETTQPGVLSCHRCDGDLWGESAVGIVCLVVNMYSGGKCIYINISHIYIYHIYSNICICMYVYIYIRICICTCICIYKRKCICICIRMRIRICICQCLYVYVYVYVYV